MITKADLAADIGCPYDQFRVELRALEKKHSDFYTGRRQYLNEKEEALIRNHFVDFKPLPTRKRGNKNKKKLTVATS